MKTTKTTATITLLVAAAIAMAGCTPTTPTEPTGSSSASSSATPTPTNDPTTPPSPTPGEEATSESEAIEGASQAAQGYFDASFTMLSTPGLGAEYLTALIVPGSPMVQQAQLTAESGDRMEGAPVQWTTNAAMSTVGSITDGNGATTQYGSVELYGCADASQATYYDASGNSVPRATNAAPYVWSVYFDSSSATWLIYQLKPLTDRDGNPVEGAPQC